MWIISIFVRENILEFFIHLVFDGLRALIAFRWELVDIMVDEIGSHAHIVVGVYLRSLARSRMLLLHHLDGAILIFIK